MSDEFDVLVERYLGGSATEDETRRLEELLKADPAALRSFLLALDEDVALRKIGSFVPTREPVTRRHRVWNRPAPNPWAPVFTAAGIVAACLILLSLISTPETTPRTAKRPGQIQSPEERRHAEDRLVEIERERRTLIDVPRKVEEQKRRIEELDVERRSIEEDLKQTVDLRPPEPPPAPAKEKAPEKSSGTTVTAPPARAEISALTLERVEGGVFVLVDAVRVAAVQGGKITAGQGLETVGPHGLAVASFADGTRLELKGDASIRDAFEGDGTKGKRLFLARGSLLARVAHQPMTAPLTIMTPHAEVKVLGTTLRLVVEGDERGSTRLEVSEGKVAIRRGDGKSLEVAAGRFAVASGGGEFASKPLPIDEILLGPEQARLVGVEWKPVKDPETAGGLALESLETTYKVRRPGGNVAYDSVRNRPNFVLFAFMADAGRDYHVWIRGRTMATTEKTFHDEVAIEPLTGQLSQKCRQLGPTGDNAFCYTGWKLYNGYGWIGGYGEDGTSDTVPLSIRFARPGLQTLKLYILEAPMRVEGIWLSTTQATRPAADQKLPLREGK